ncbi:MAG: hypothetical protein M3Z27_04435 [Actinomycetota bacterium]|nr:hypothetical protein [Actinomycetota bacterium]
MPEQPQQPADWQPVRRVAPRIHTGELISTTSALLLATLMLLFDWYGAVGASGPERSAPTTVENAWSALPVTRWVLVATILIAVGTTVVHATQRAHGARTDTGLPVALAGTLTGLLLGYRVLIDPPNPSAVLDVKLGGYLGLLAAVSIALGGFESVREEREQRAGLAPVSRSR